MHALLPPENGIKASLFHLPMNLSGLKVYGSSQYRAMWHSLSPFSGLARQGYPYDCNEDQQLRRRSWSAQEPGSLSSHQPRFQRRERCPRHYTSEPLVPTSSLTTTSGNFEPERTGGNILKVSYNVLYPWAFSHRGSRHSESLQDAYAVTRLSLGMSSWVYGCGYQIVSLDLGHRYALTGRRPSGRTS